MNVENAGTCLAQLVISARAGQELPVRRRLAV